MKFLSFSIPKVPITPPSSLGPKGGIDTAGTVFKNALAIIIILSIVLALIYMVIAGIQWITSGGDKNKVQAARSKMTYAIIGLIVSFGAFALVNLLGYLFGINLLSF